MQLIVGLGNPGAKYRHTRHNIGFVIADAAAARTHLRLTTHRATPSGRSAWTEWFKRQELAEVGQGTYQGHVFAVIKPLTFMNRSGEAVAHYMRALGLQTQDILVIFDDISLPVGTVRSRLHRARLQLKEQLDQILGDGSDSRRQAPESDRTLRNEKLGETTKRA